MLNQILYGPPGTGKTFAVIELALEILEPAYLEANRSNRAALKKRFDELSTDGEVRFVTFHQSFSYEDFVEGLRADHDADGQIRYAVEDGIFKILCDTAAAKVTRQEAAPVSIEGRRIWKMSLGNTLASDAYIYDECIENNYILLGYGGDTDFTGCKNREEVFERSRKAGSASEEGSYAITAVTNFLLKMKKGDLVVVSDGNTKFRAIAEVTGDYRQIAREPQGDGDDKYGQCRNVKWLRVYSPSLPYDQLMQNQFSQMTLYELKSHSIDKTKLTGLLSNTGNPVSTSASTTAAFRIGDTFGSGYEVVYASNDVIELIKPNKKRLPIGMSLIRDLADCVRDGKLTVTNIRQKEVFEKMPGSLLEPYLVNGYENILSVLVDRYLGFSNRSSVEAPAVSRPKVLIIDEINRGNVSKIFGDLITLIEPSKRKDAEEALEVILPYSKSRFSVPANVHIIGTMNTADRSLTSLDIALRRRFHFKEMLPRPELLGDIELQGLNISQMLSIMNERIEVLLDRDHRLGHAYFLPLREDRSVELLMLTEPSLDRQQVSQSAFDWLCRLSSTLRKSGASLVELEDRRWLRLDNYVGVIETPCGTRIEILPKHLDEGESLDAARSLLVKMLSTTLDLPVREVGVSSLQKFDAPLNEWVMRQFLVSLDRLVKRGIRCEYQLVEEEQRFLRGQLSLARQMRQRLDTFADNLDLWVLPVDLNSGALIDAEMCDLPQSTGRRLDSHQ